MTEPSTAEKDRRDEKTNLAGVRDRLKEKLSGCIQTGKITLASGKETDFYFDGRLVSLDPEGSVLIAELVLDEIRRLGLQGVGRNFNDFGFRCGGQVGKLEFPLLGITDVLHPVSGQCPGELMKVKRIVVGFQILMEQVA